MLRDPVARAYSHYRMVTDPNGTPEQKKARGTKYTGKTFEECIELEFEELNKLGITHDITSEEFAQRYLTQVPNSHGSHSIIARGMYHLQIIPWLQSFPKEQILILHMGDMPTSSEATQETVNKAFEYLEIPPWKLVDTEKRNSREYDQMSIETKRKYKDIINHIIKNYMNYLVKIFHGIMILMRQLLSKRKMK